MADKFKACSVENCNGNADYRARGGKGLCHSHFRRLKRHGDPLAGKATPMGELLRFAASAAAHRGDECLIWPYGMNERGYGLLRVNGRHIGAHRYVCLQAHGEPPTPNHQAAHSCGTPSCVSPRHLRWSTSSENQADRLIHGTDIRGEKHPHSKLTEFQALEILAMKGTETPSEIAGRFGVSQGLVSSIHCGRSWSWLTTRGE